MKYSILLPYYNRKQLLLNSLKSMEYFYSDNLKYKLEVVIVDDCSTEEHRLENSLHFNLDIKLIRLDVKNGINPCYPYNVAARNSTGDVLILSSPETFHTCNMFEMTNNFEKLTNDSYLLMSVFCLTEKKILENLFDNFEVNINKFNENKYLFKENLGENGYYYNNRYGSWYLHSEIKPCGLNFCTAITRENYYNLSGFDERFRFGTGYDDDEFRDRIQEMGLKFIYYDDFTAIHVDHESVSNCNQNTNSGLYSEAKIIKYYRNDSWGMI